jgi:chemotaxis protein methyltransferase WspC
VKLPELRSSPSPRIAPPIATSAAPAQTAAQALKAAHALADAGHLGEAAEACERFLHEHGAHAQAHYLLGLVRDTAGRHKDAAAHYRKALYLDPQHHEALVHLAFLLEQQGDKTGAALLRGRLQRHARLDKPA